MSLNIIERLEILEKKLEEHLGKPHAITFDVGTVMSAIISCEHCGGAIAPFYGVRCRQCDKVICKSCQTKPCKEAKE